MFVDPKCDEFLEELNFVVVRNLMDSEAIIWNKISLEVVFLV